MIYKYCIVFLLLFVVTLGKSLPLKSDSNPLLSRIKRSAECRCTCGRNIGAPDVNQPISDPSTPDEVNPDDTTWLTSAGLFEGDIKLNGTIEEEFINFKSALPGRRWPNRIVFYRLRGIYNFRPILDAMAHIQDRTCIKFVHDIVNRERAYVSIHQGGGCWSMIGRQGGEQGLSLGHGCWVKHTIVHELMHAIGFYHEQARTDRDNYVWIYKDNIIYGKHDQFLPAYDGTLIGNYDLESVMHYPSHAFSNGRGPTIVNKRNPNKELSNRYGLTNSDASKIKRLYGC